MAFQNSMINAGNTLVYTSNGDNAITCLIVCNTMTFDPLNPTNDTYYFSLYAVPAAEVSGTTAMSKHTIVNGIPITAGETLSLDQEKIVLSNGDILIASCNSGNKLAITVSTLVV